MLIRSLALVALLVPALAFAVTPKEKKKNQPRKPAAPIQTVAPSPKSKPADLGTIIVTATRTEQPTNTTPAFLTVISRDDIERSGATQVVDVLRGRAGVEVTDLFGDGSRPNIGLRGFGENAPSNTLVLVDGRRLNNPDIASADFNSIPLDTVERIEILQGSAGALYGDQAVGGVINIITRTSRSTSASVELNSGSYGRIGHRARGTYAVTRNLRFGLNANAQHTDNYRAHNRLDLYTVGGRGDYDWSGGGLFVELRHEDERLQLPGALLQAQYDANRRQAAPASTADFNNTATDIARVGVRHAVIDSWTFVGEVSSRVANGDFRLTGLNGTQDRRVYGTTPRFSGEIPVWGGQAVQLTVGSDIYVSEYRLMSPFGAQKNDQQTYDGYVQAVIPIIPDVGLTAAVRYGEVHNNLRDGFTFATTQTLTDEKVAHSLGAYWRILPGLKLFARHDRNFRFAKLDEFFGAGGTGLALNLKTQTGDSYETGIEFQDRRLSLSALLYRLDLKNEIVFDPVLFVFFGGNTNLDKSRRDGVLLELRYALLESLTAFGCYTHIDATAKSGNLSGKTIPLTAEHQGRAGLEWSPVKNWNTFVEMQAYSERFFSGDFDNTIAPLPSYEVVNIGGNGRVGSFRAQARVNNLLSERYSEVGVAAFPDLPSYFPSPQINFQVTLGYEFGSNKF